MSRKSKKPITKSEMSHLQSVVNETAPMTKEIVPLVHKLYVALEEDAPHAKGVSKKGLNKLAPKVERFALQGFNWSYFYKFASALDNLLLKEDVQAHLPYRAWDLNVVQAHSGNLLSILREMEEVSSRVLEDVKKNGIPDAPTEEMVLQGLEIQELQASFSAGAKGGNVNEGSNPTSPEDLKEMGVVLKSMVKNIGELNVNSILFFKHNFFGVWDDIAA